MKQGRLFIISGPSGVGKSTVLKTLLDRRKNARFSVSATTRPYGRERLTAYTTIL